MRLRITLASLGLSLLLVGFVLVPAVRGVIWADHALTLMAAGSDGQVLAGVAGEWRWVWPCTDAAHVEELLETQAEVWCFDGLEGKAVRTK